MQIVAQLRSGASAVVLATALMALPAFGQSQAPQPAAQPSVQQNAPYSGAADAAAKRSPDSDCKSPNGSLGAKSPEQLQQALAASKTPTYTGPSDDAAKQAMATCGGQ